MSEPKTVETKEVKTQEKAVVKPEGKEGNRGFKRNTKKLRPRKAKEGSHRGSEDNFDHKIINIRRVSRMYKGGRRMRLSVFVAVGDRNGLVGVAVGKGADVRSAQQKAILKAKKHLIKVNLKGNTIPHMIDYKYGAAKVVLKPAAPGTGIIAGSSVRIVAELAGIKDVLGKILGTNNSINNAYAAVNALNSLRSTRI